MYMRTQKKENCANRVDSYGVSKTHVTTFSMIS